MLACFPSFSSFTYQQQSKKRYKKRSYKASSAITLILQQKKEEKKEMKMKQTLKFITSVFVWALIMNQSNARYRTGFIKTRGCHFVVNGSPFLANGFNAYWLMLLASNPSERSKVSNAFKEASSHGLTVVRTWAFSDGGPVPLQVSPGSYNQQMFQGLDFVISEARRYRMRVILSLANNYDCFGGKKQYVEWARNEGQNIGSDDDFFTNYVAKQYYKNHVKAVLTRYNTITKVMYKDDPTIFAWELMNEPRCTSDLSGNTIQAWITEMAAHVKSIDSNHLLEAGLEGFYSGYDQGRNKANPAGFQVGTDFISNNKVAGIDFATLHSYPDQWLSNTNDEAQLQFLNTWLDTHIEDSENVLKKPLLLTEFGKSWKDPGFSNSQRDVLFNAVYSKIYMSARRGGAAAGGMFWQLLIGGMDNYRDGYEIVLTDNSSTNTVITVQSKRLHYLGKLYSQKYKNAVAQVRKRLSKGVSKERKDIGN